MSSPAANMWLVRRYVAEVWNQGRLSALERYVAADYEFVPPDGSPPIRGPGGLAAHVSTLRATLEGLMMRIDRMVAEGDEVAWAWTMTGRHVGPALGMLAQMGVLPPLSAVGIGEHASDPQ